MVLEKLAEVAEHRAPFVEAWGAIVAASLASVGQEGAVVELGAGDGQLTRQLVPCFGQRLLVTEPSPEAFEGLKATFPRTEVLRAEAASIPLQDGTAAAVVSACVLDVVIDLEAALAEAYRVLAPGGRLLHWLDMTTDLAPLACAVALDDEVCIVPNLWSEFDAEGWPEDVFMLPRSDLSAVAEALGEAGEALREIGQTRDPQKAQDYFTAVHESAEARRGLRRAFAQAMGSADAEARARFASFRGQPLSSAKMFHERLLAAAKAVGFRIAQADIVRARTPLPGALCRRNIVGFMQSRPVEGEETGFAELGVYVVHAVR